MMVSVVISAGIIAGSVLVLKKFQTSQVNADLESQQKEQMGVATFSLSRDLENAVFLQGTTTSTNFFEGARTYGILPSPFAANPSGSDGVQIIKINETLSRNSIYEVTAIANNPGNGTAQITITGDFRTSVTLPEDLFVLTDSNDSELFKITSPITVNGATSVIQVSQQVPATIISRLGGEYNPKIFRVQRVIYRIGNQGTTTGLYRSVTGPNGTFDAIAIDATQMRIAYTLQSQSTESNATDCASKNQSRWFAHDTTASECNWNNIRSASVELKFRTQSSEGTTVEKTFTSSAAPLSYISLTN
jgi:hypothetical protein